MTSSNKPTGQHVGNTVCAVMEATISTRMYLDGTTNFKSTSNIVDFALCQAIQAYMNDRYPIFVDQLHLTYEAP